jgi:hypothetical protein
MMEQNSEQVSLIRNIFGPRCCFAGKDDELPQERVDVQDAARSRKMADIPRLEVKSPHGDGSRHRNAVYGTRWYPHAPLGWNDPESLLRPDRHHASGGEDQLVGVVEVFRYSILIGVVIRQSRQTSGGMTFAVK